MPFLFFKKSNNSHKRKKAFIATTPKKALDYNYILCYLQAMWRKACFKFYRKTRCAEGVRWEEKKEKSILGKAFGGNADANTRIIKGEKGGFAIIPITEEGVRIKNSDFKKALDFVKLSIEQAAFL